MEGTNVNRLKRFVDLSEVDKRYQGKLSSRKKLNKFDDEDDEDEDDIENGEEDDGDDDENDEELDEDGEEDEDFDDEEVDEEEDAKASNSKKRKLEGKLNKLRFTFPFLKYFI